MGVYVAYHPTTVSWASAGAGLNNFEKVGRIGLYESICTIVNVIRSSCLPQIKCLQMEIDFLRSGISHGVGRLSRHNQKVYDFFSVGVVRQLEGGEDGEQTVSKCIRYVTIRILTHMPICHCVRVLANDRAAAFLFLSLTSRLRSHCCFRKSNYIFTRAQF